MVRIRSSSSEAARIDGAIRAWRQGDAALDERWFFHVADPGQALTVAAEESTEPGPVALPSEVDGLVIVSQTCDVVRSCVERPFVDVCPVMLGTQQELLEARRGRSTRFAVLAGLPQGFVVDLERTMTAEKALVASWKRTPGWQTDQEGTRFARLLARKRERFAYPDEFQKMIAPLQKRILEKHDRQSPEGHALRALHEIRVRVSPSWQASRPLPFFWFVREPEQLEFGGSGWTHWLQRWRELILPSDHYQPAEALVTTLASMTGDDYVHSDRLDLDHLSG